jgi:hypothetical protein
MENISERRRVRAERLAATLEHDEELRRRVAALLVGLRDIGVDEAIDSVAAVDALLAAAAQATATGECRVGSSAGGLRPILMPSATDLDGVELYWCCTGHVEEHCSKQVDR